MKLKSQLNISSLAMLLWSHNKNVSPATYHFNLFLPPEPHGLLWFLKARPDFSCCRESEWLLPVCADSYSADTIANRSGTRLRFIALQRVWVTVAGVCRQLLCRHYSEPIGHTAAVHRAACVRARETVHIHGDTRNEARVVWPHL
jgi:hypothetical protein